MRKAEHRETRDRRAHELMDERGSVAKMQAERQALRAWAHVRGSSMFTGVVPYIASDLLVLETGKFKLDLAQQRISYARTPEEKDAATDVYRDLLNKYLADPLNGALVQPPTLVPPTPPALTTSYQPATPVRKLPEPDIVVLTPETASSVDQQSDPHGNGREKRSRRKL